ncbi:MAG: helix-turn-helix transcriptional regulator [Dehalobacter sp. 4CP]|jgi:transcriptional regulator with XRE-family HTH domain|uniref:Helix-turn-helix domain-containing protein n=2 Tax=Dehalobacter restrictus TaxID=55583 RepID=A0A857DF24_9FIRM|nr:MULTISPECIES: helix-turn-helix transcriptional regulator [Dehalobacter]NBJ16014.1 helix-turn-helix transcriptional regulator [Dehalobacter sp. 4CP]AFV01215.1 putative transcriptional regulator [Dehalobacter sp. DCA]AFV04255.1 putative transcriptional regulator [Dehalobacter sp. CF]AHF08803.1 transcriptional regulator [Dehalobacter restrictus DSM 9455]EQB21911.1 hypothetical protein UNSWDHB_770 [Dehalobacter sp. UNSWDHB]
MSLGSKIREIRKKKHLKQKELAEIAGISVSYLCEIERDKTNPSIKTLFHLTQALGVRLSTLLGDQEY